MKNEDIEILEDFSDNQLPNNNSSAPDLNQQAAPSSPAVESSPSPVQDLNVGIAEDLNANPTPVTPAETPAPVQPIESVSEFEKMVNEAPTVEAPVEQPAPVEPVAAPEPIAPAPNNQSYENGFIASDYAGDSNNDLVESNGENVEPKEDLTITAVYPNGFAVDQKEELENTQVIKPKKKKNADLPLIIIVGVLAITLVVLLIVFYL